MRASRSHGNLARKAAENARKGGWEALRDAPKVLPYWRPSNSGSCRAKLAYNRLGHRPDFPFPPAAREKMDKGTVLHDWIRDYLLPGSGISVLEKEAELDAVFLVGKGKAVESVHLHGSCDAILGDGEGLVMCEIKTTSLWGYKGTVKDIGKPEHYSMGYYTQANRYAHMLQQERKVEVPEVCIVLYNVNGDEDEETGLSWRDFWFEASDEDFQEDIKNLVSIQKTIKTGTHPQRGYEKIGWECTGCNFLGTCWSIESERQYADSKSAKKSAELFATLTSITKGDVPR